MRRRLASLETLTRVVDKSRGHELLTRVYATIDDESFRSAFGFVGSPCCYYSLFFLLSQVIVTINTIKYIITYYRQLLSYSFCHSYHYSYGLSMKRKACLVEFLEARVWGPCQAVDRQLRHLKRAYSSTGAHLPAACTAAERGRRPLRQALAEVFFSHFRPF